MRPFAAGPVVVLTGPLLWAGGTYGVASVTMPELYGPAWADGGFGGAPERDDDATELLRRLADLERVAATELPNLPLETTAIAEDASAIISSANRKGPGRMVLADLGVIDGAREVSMAEITGVFVFADNDGGARLGTVSVTRKKTGKGTVITLVGRGGGGSETIVIRVERAEKPADKPTVPGPKQASLPVGPPALGTCAGFYRAYMQQNPGQAAINPAHVQFYDEIDGKTCKPLGLTCYAYPSREMDALLPKLHAAGRKGTAGTIWNTNGFYACMPAPQPTR